jgi:hypothetical protein
MAPNPLYAAMRAYSRARAHDLRADRDAQLVREALGRRSHRAEA